MKKCFTSLIFQSQGYKKDYINVLHSSSDQYAIIYAHCESGKCYLKLLIQSFTTGEMYHSRWWQSDKGIAVWHCFWYVVFIVICFFVWNFLKFTCTIGLDYRQCKEYFTGRKSCFELHAENEWDCNIDQGMEPFYRMQMCSCVWNNHNGSWDLTNNYSCDNQTIW